MFDTKKEIFLDKNSHLNIEENSQIKLRTVKDYKNYSDTRRKLTASLKRTQVSFQGTKYHFGPLSPGCRTCADGTWSCLFINGLCKAHCFFCPTEQMHIGVPQTNNLQFDRVQDYIDYLKYFKFEGVSFSGGEPFLTPDVTIRFANEIRTHIDENMHFWVYTSGAGLTRDIMKKLMHLGLNEIRFNLVGAQYSLEKLRIAAEYIRTITVEIPAIPEDYEKLITLLPQLKDGGVAYINLHQLRCTPYNRHHFAKRNYTIVSESEPVVLESELTALRILYYAEKGDFSLPINYCSFPYKNRYQAMYARRRAAKELASTCDEITENGYLRRLFVSGEQDLLKTILSQLCNKRELQSLWTFDAKQVKLYFHSSLWSVLPWEKVKLGVCYFRCLVRQSLSYMRYFKKLQLNPRRNIFSEREIVFPETFLSEELKSLFCNHILPHYSSLLCQTMQNDQEFLKTDIQSSIDYQLRQKIIFFEFIKDGLSDVE